jgi:hypothetical protein
VEGRSHNLFQGLTWSCQQHSGKTLKSSVDIFTKAAIPVSRDMEIPESRKFVEMRG